VILDIIKYLLDFFLDLMIQMPLLVIYDCLHRFIQDQLVGQIHLGIFFWYKQRTIPWHLSPKDVHIID